MFKTNHGLRVGPYKNGRMIPTKSVASAAARRGDFCAMRVPRWCTTSQPISSPSWFHAKLRHELWSNFFGCDAGACFTSPSMEPFLSQDVSYLPFMYDRGDVVVVPKDSFREAVRTHADHSSLLPSPPTRNKYHGVSLSVCSFLTCQLCCCGFCTEWRSEATRRILPKRHGFNHWHNWRWVCFYCPFTASSRCTYFSY